MFCTLSVIGIRYIFGGYDSCYKNDIMEYNFATQSWSKVNFSGRAPRARYRATCVVHEDCMIMFGGHDGTKYVLCENLFTI